MTRYLRTGALAGLCGTLASALLLLVVGERSIADAIAIEDAAAVPGEVHEEMFSRTTQMAGGALGLILMGLLLGTVFGIVFAANRHRLGAGRDWNRARRLGFVAFVSLYLVPNLKYPANPPAVGNPDTVDERTMLYLGMMAVAIVAAIVANQVRVRLGDRGRGAYAANPIAAAVWVAVVGLAWMVLPANPDSIEVPADLIWRFRLASAAGQLAFWMVAGTVFGWLTLQAEGVKVFGKTATAEDSADDTTTAIA